MTRSIALLAGLLSVATCCATAQTYNPKTGIYEMPGSPVSPTSYSQCDDLQRQWSQLHQALEDAHQKCLDTHHAEPDDPRASLSSSNPICSHSACQALHTARTENQKRGDDRVQTCRADVAQYQRKKQLEQEQIQALQRQQQKQAEDAKQSAEQRQQQASRLEQQRQDAAEKMAQVLVENADQIRSEVLAKQQAQNVPPVSGSTTAEFTPDAPPDPIAPATAIELSFASPLVKAGNPPDDVTAPWMAGQRRLDKDGYYDKPVYIWQFSVADAGLCPDISDGNSVVQRQALFQETATAHYQVANEHITRSVVDKQRQFVRCLPAYEFRDYPKYKIFPPHFKPTGSAGIGDRG
jgi:hypothetical protein